MNLHSATSAIISAVIFNAIIIPLLIPIALRGVAYKPVGADAVVVGLLPSYRSRSHIRRPIARKLLNQISADRL